MSEENYFFSENGRKKNDRRSVCENEITIYIYLSIHHLYVCIDGEEILFLTTLLESGQGREWKNGGNFMLAMTYRALIFI